jgi:hypothetical protein
MPIIEIYRVRVDPANIERLLEIHDEAVAEYQVDPQRLEAACGPRAAELHALMADELGHDEGELVHSSGSVWATAR